MIISSARGTPTYSAVPLTLSIKFRGPFPLVVALSMGAGVFHGHIGGSTKTPCLWETPAPVGNADGANCRLAMCVEKMYVNA